MINKSILLILAAKDFSEDEYLNVKYVLERKGYNIFIASDSYSVCTGNRGMKVRPDVSFYNMNPSNFAALLIIGGDGIRKYRGNENALRIIRGFNDSRKVMGAICAAPLLLADAGVLNFKKVTCFDADRKEIEKKGIEFSEEPCVRDGKIITAQNPQAAGQFAETVIAAIENR